MLHTRRSVVLLAALAVLSLQLVRAEHIHPAGVEGRTRSFVHSHPLGVATAGGPHATATHGDHRFAIFLAAVYESVLRHSFDHVSSDLATAVARRESGVPLRAACVVQPPNDRRPPGVIADTSSERAPPIL